MSDRTPRAGARAALHTGRLIAGLQPVREALRVHGAMVDEVQLDSRRSPRLESLAQFAEDQGVAKVVRVARTELDRLSRTVAHQGVVAWAPPLRLVSPETLLGRDTLLAVALDQVQDPQNFGAVIRSAVGLGQCPVIWGEHGSAPLTPATFRASAGAIEHAELCRVRSLTAWLVEAQERQIQVIGLDPHAPVRLEQVDFARQTVLVIGSEDEGMTRSVRRACTKLVSLSGQTRIASLNASVAAGISLHWAVMSRMRSDAARTASLGPALDVGSVGADLAPAVEAEGS